MMGRERFQLSYCTKDPSNRPVCAILSALGYRRSDVVKAMLEVLADRYGLDVLKKENVDVLLYLIRNPVAETKEKPGGVLTLAAFPETEERPGRPLKKEKPMRAKKPPEPVKQAAEEERPAPVPQISRESEPAGQQAPDESPEDLDKKRAAIMEYLENGFYEDMEG